LKNLSHRRLISGLLTFLIISVSYAEDQSTWLKNEPITPILPATELDKAKAQLGKRLFHDVNLSADGTVSCASCHSIANAGIDGLKLSAGIKGQIGTRNAPTVFNSSLNFRQFWDGRARTLEEQVSGPLTNPMEMAGNWDDALRYIRAHDKYKQAFTDSYGGQATKTNVAHAIAEFERSLVTPNGDFDRYLKGDESAIDQATKHGYQLFQSFGCIACHQGVAVGGNFYEKIGVVIPYTYELGEAPDLGRYQLTSDDDDKFEFKVPSLRNVARTAPYLHDGSIATLEEVVTIMAKHQLGRELNKAEVRDIVKFLHSLNGELNVR